MLQIANRRFSLATSFSGLSLRLAPNAAGPKQHRWSMNAVFVPEDDDHALPPWRGPEMWRLGIQQIIGLHVTHWHELEHFEIDEADLDILNIGSSLQNIARYGGWENPPLSLAFGSFRFICREGYLLTLEADGEVLLQTDPNDADLSGEFTLRAQIPFHQVSIAVPLNATDSLTTATSIARREIGLTTHARTHLRRFDPSQPIWKPVENSHHTVLLETPWRG
jgi:hypothetical protein